ncbi:hypothetical protein [Streptomyces griseofuscus]|uniref:Uncharacterized protein n=1 Tax=Streptomyces griseofuscus TaxID=146922 RepID=A0A3R8RWL7_9ACTN|nr:hypothetical protein [Streptomyces griseofuscus]RRQ81523.1 hypothetical protein CQW44_30445 [Streptomyces griseofuscus]
MSDRIDELSERARWFLSEFDEIDLAAICASEEASAKEARQWARHGYEIGQRHCGWTDHGVAPAWLTEGWPRAFANCEHLQRAAEYDEALARVRALAEVWQDAPDPLVRASAADLLSTIRGPRPRESDQP